MNEPAEIRTVEEQAALDAATYHLQRQALSSMMDETKKEYTSKARIRQIAQVALVAFNALLATLEGEAQAIAKPPSNILVPTTEIVTPPC